MTIRAAPSHDTSTTGLDVGRADLLAALARALDYRAEPAVPHHGRVAALAAAAALRTPGADPLEVFYAALVHDVGLLDAQWDLAHPPNLTEQANRPVARSHPLTGAQLLATVPGMLPVAEIVLDHHEWADGHGYPRGKRVEEIRPAAQVVRFADTCDFVLREQGSPELLPLLDAVRTRTARQVAPDVAEAGAEALGQPGFYPQLLGADDVDELVRDTIEHLASGDAVAGEAEMTGLLELFACLADVHASDKIGHSRRVANLTVMVAMALGLAPEDANQAKWAALVHDLGMITVPKAMLDEPRLFSEKELAQIRRQSARTEEFLGQVSGLEEVTRIAVGFTEAFDGSGVPQGRAGYAIPLGSRIIAACETFDALTSHRPYRAARDVSLAIDILVRGRGSLFDPEVVSAAVPVFLICQPTDDRTPAWM